VASRVEEFLKKSFSEDTALHTPFCRKSEKDLASPRPGPPPGLGQPRRTTPTKRGSGGGPAQASPGRRGGARPGAVTPRSRRSDGGRQQPRRKQAGQGPGRALRLVMSCAFGDPATTSWSRTTPRPRFA
jgi:hypothetical protein